MKIDVTFSELSREFTPEFGEIHNVSDGGFERGYAQGFERGYEDGTHEGYSDGFADGHSEGYIEGEAKGYADGLAARTYEIWTFTLTDGTIVEKEVALL